MTSDHDALLRAIIANPDEDTPRLVFADWLEENGDAKRAAFIRAQVEVCRLRDSDTPAAHARGFLEATGFTDLGEIDWLRTDAELGAIQALERVADNPKLWPSVRKYGLPHMNNVDLRYLERGFHCGVWVGNPSAFLKHARALFRAVPLTHVEFTELTAEQAREFVAGGYLARVRRLSLDEDVEPEAIRVLGNHSDAAGVTWLDFDGGERAGDRVSALLAGAHWSGVTRLEVRNLNDDDTVASDRLFGDLFRRPMFRRVRHLVAYGNGLGDAAARPVASAGLTELRHLILSLNGIGQPGIGDAGAMAIAGSKTLPNLRYLDLQWNNIGGTGAAALIVSRKFPNLEVLILDTNPIRGPDPKVLASASRGPTLRVLSLAQADLGVRGLAALGRCPAVQGLWFLSFQRCGLTNAELAAFTKTATLGELTAFDLEDNKLAVRGMQAVAQWPGAGRLQSIDVSGNAIGERGAKALVESPYLKGLRRINASGRGTSRLRKHFTKKVVP